MKRYIIPETKVIKIATFTILAASQETLGVTGGTHSGSFNSRECDFDDDDY